jgi:hypothetical protein
MQGVEDHERFPAEPLRGRRRRDDQEVKVESLTQERGEGLSRGVRATGAAENP